jgi:hypothetical protein
MPENNELYLLYFFPKVDTASEKLQNGALLLQDVSIKGSHPRNAMLTKIIHLRTAG